MQKIIEKLSKIKTFPYFQTMQMVILPSALVFIIGMSTIDTQFTFLLTLSTAFISWSNSQVISKLNFTRGEVSKSRDSISQYIEKMFDEIESLFADRSLKTEKLDSIISGRISILEMRVNHIKKRNKIEFLNSDDFTSMRNHTLDILENSGHNYKSQLADLKFNYLEKIESSYSDWHDGK